MEKNNPKEFFETISRQSNEFIESSFVQEFTEHELKTMEFVISTIKPADLELTKKGQIKVISKPATEFAQMIGAHPNDIYQRASMLTKGLMSKQINFKLMNGKEHIGFETHSFFTSMAYRESQLIICINPFVIPYFVNVSSSFTEFRLANILRIGSSYGIRLYKLLKQYENTQQKYRIFSIAELRTHFGIGTETNENGSYIKYDKYSNFKTKVIETAISHINKSTDLLISYTEIKAGRKVDKLKFHIKSKMTQYEQAKILFEEFMDGLSKGVLKNHWDANKGERRFDIFRPSFNKWLAYVCKNFIAASTDLLEIQSDDIFSNNETMMKEIYSAQFPKK